jgi:hypothetical protein
MFGCAGRKGICTTADEQSMPTIDVQLPSVHIVSRGQQRRAEALEQACALAGVNHRVFLYPEPWLIPLSPIRLR